MQNKEFIGMFAKLQKKKTFSFVMSVQPHTLSAWFPLCRFSWNLIFNIFIKMSQEN